MFKEHPMELLEKFKETKFGKYNKTFSEEERKILGSTLKDSIENGIFIGDNLYFLLGRFYNT